MQMWLVEGECMRVQCGLGRVHGGERGLDAQMVNGAEQRGIGGGVEESYLSNLQWFPH